MLRFPLNKRRGIAFPVDEKQDCVVFGALSEDKELMIRFKRVIKNTDEAIGEEITLRSYQIRSEKLRASDDPQELSRYLKSRFRDILRDLEKIPSGEEKLDFLLDQAEDFNRTSMNRFTASVSVE